MSLDGTYEDGNIFAKILRGEAPAAKVFEDGEILAFMDVFPQSRGHTLVIPKHSQARWPRSCLVSSASPERCARR